MYDQLTPSDIKKMQEEIEHRKLVVRKEALEDVKEARAHYLQVCLSKINIFDLSIFMK